MPLTVHCPKCGKTDIREKNVGYASLPVTDWTVVDGVLYPQSYDTDVPADWGCEDTAKPYICKDCRWEGALDGLTIKGLTAPCPAGCDAGNPPESCGVCSGTGVIHTEG